MRSFQPWITLACLALASPSLAQSDGPLATAAIVNMSSRSVSVHDAAPTRSEVTVPDLFTGGLSTEIPINMPPGRGGLTPWVTLRYRSTHLDSWVGVGWDLRPGAIERDTLKGLDFSGDGFVLDDGYGRTTLVAEGGGRYDPQIQQSFYRIRQLPSEDGRTYWEATSKDGTRYLYGRTPAARQDDPADASHIFSWQLETVRDTRGNTIQYTYEKVAAPARELYLSAIVYASNGALSAPHRIAFVRAAGRPDVLDSFATGFKTRLSERLSYVDVYSLDRRQRRYELRYDDTSAAAGSSLLASVTQTDRDAQNRLPPTTLKYASGSLPWSYAARTGAGPVQPETGPIWRQCLSGDFDGDGRIDVACNGGGTRWNVGLSTAEGFAQPFGGGGVDPHDANAANRCFAGDLNGDGKTDIACYEFGQPGFGRGDWAVALSTGSAWTTSTFHGGPHVAFPIGNQCLTGDFDGDGRTDLTCYSGPNSNNWHTVFSTGTAFSGGGGPAINLSDAQVTNRCVTADFNGDGRTDFACYMAGQPGHVAGEWHVAMATGSTGSTGPPWRATRFTGQGPGVSIPVTDQCLTGDFNGDGKTDLACYSGFGSRGNWHVAMSTGSGWAEPWGANGLNTSGGSHCLAGDFNGDGKTDIACYDGFLIADWEVAFSTGSKWQKPARPVFWGGQILFGRARERCLVGELHGFGKAEVLCHTGRAGWGAFVGPRGSNDLLTGVTRPGGGVTRIDYGSSLDTKEARIGFSLEIVRAVSSDDGRGVTSTTSYEYDGGFFNRGAREFRGFHHVRIRGPEGEGKEREIRDIWFHQGNDTAVDANDPAAPTGYTKGFVYKERTSDENEVRKSEQTTTYGAASGLSRFQPAVQVDELTCEGPACSHTVRLQMSYDRFGNAEKTTHLGELNDPNDDWQTTWTFVPNEEQWIVGLPSSTATIKNGKRIAQTDFYYDGSGTCDTPSTNQKPVVGNLTRVVPWLEGGASPGYLMAYSAVGHLTCLRDPNGNKTIVTFDPSESFIVKTEDALHHVTSRTHFEPDHLDDGPYGQLRTFTDLNGNTLEQQFDTFGRKIKVLFPDERWVTYSYDDPGNPQRQRIVTTRSGGLVTTSYIDGLGRTWLQQSIGVEGKVIDRQTDVDARGLIVRSYPPFYDGDNKPDVAGRYEYDALQRLKKFTNTDGAERTYCFDGWTRSSRDENGHVNRQALDAFGNLATVEEFDGVHPDCALGRAAAAQPYAVTAYTHDPYGRVLTITDAKKNKIELTYDSLGRLVRASDPDRGQAAYRHDAAGNLVQVTDAARRDTFYHPDPLSRLMQVDFGSPKPAGAGDLIYTWDGAAKNGIGRLAWTATADTRVTFTYDPMGRPLERTYRVRGRDYRFAFSFDAAGRIETLLYPDNQSVSYSYSGRYLDRVFDSRQEYARYRAYDEFGNPGRVDFGNGASLLRTYYRAGNAECPQPSYRLCTIELHDASGTVVRRSRYGYDPAGNVSSIRSLQAADEYKYDASDRLVSATRTRGDGMTSAVTFAYDELGNLTRNSAVGDYTYDADKPHAVKTAGANRYTYDASGNMATAPHYKFTFDQQNQLVDVRQTDGSVFGRLHLRMTYAGTGERVAVQDGSSWTVNLSDVYRCDARACAKVLYGTEGRIGTFSADAGQYVAGDHLNSTAAVLDARGGVAAQFDYLPFGALASPDAPANVGSPYRFTGQELDRSGLYYLHARYYDPIIGRFISPDPLLGSLGAPQSLNPYSYVLNNPLKLTDPTGMKMMDSGGGDGRPWESDHDHERGEHEGRWSGSAETGYHIDSLGSDLPDWDSPSERAPEQAAPKTNEGLPEQLDRNLPRDGETSRNRSSAPSHEAGRPDHEGPPRPGGAPNFDPMNDRIESDHAATAAAVIATWLFGTRPLVRGLIGALQRDDAVVVDKQVLEDEKPLENDGPPVNYGRKGPSYYKSRGWNEKSIKDAYTNPYTTRQAVDKTTGDAATAYYPTKGDQSHIVVNDRTGEVIQVSDKTKPNWRADSSIEDPYKGK